MAHEPAAAKIQDTNTAGLRFRSVEIEALSVGRVLLAVGVNGGSGATDNTAILDTSPTTPGPVVSILFASTDLRGLSDWLNRVTIAAGENAKALLAYPLFGTNVGPSDGNISVATLS